MISDLLKKLMHMLGAGMQVEAKDVIFREVAEVTVEGRRSLRVQGLVFHSSLAVDKVSIDRRDGIAHVHVTLVPAGGSRSGNFLVDVPLDGVAKVQFGPAAAQIWPVP